MYYIENPETYFDRFPSKEIDFTEFVDCIKNGEKILQGTPIYFDMSEMCPIGHGHTQYEHLPTGTIVEIEYSDYYDDWSSAYIKIHGIEDSIWIGDDCSNCWYKSDDLTGFMFNCFIAYI